VTSCQIAAADLEALHDAELARGSASAVRVHASACPRCAAELARLDALASLLRELPDGAPAPDLWSALVPRLHEIDAGLPAARPAPPVRAHTAAARSFPPPKARRRSGAGGWWRSLPPLAAAAGVAALALLVLGRTPPAQALDVVRSLDTFGAPVLVMPENANGATVIWLLDEPASEESRDGEGGHATAP